MSLHAVSRTLTPSEAGFVLGRSAAAVNKAVDEGVIEAKVVRKGTIAVRFIGPAELRFLKLAGAFQKDFTAAGRRRIYVALKGVGGEANEVKLGAMRFDLRPVDHDLAARLERLDVLKASVETRKDGEPVIRGTDVPVHVIAGLARGETIAEVVEDYPNLTQDQIETAIEYAKAYPKRGRPYPSRSLKRAMADLALHELELERTVDGPRKIDL